MTKRIRQRFRYFYVFGNWYFYMWVDGFRQNYFSCFIYNYFLFGKERANCIWDLVLLDNWKRWIGVGGRFGNRRKMFWFFRQARRINFLTEMNERSILTYTSSHCDTYRTNLESRNSLTNDKSFASRKIRRARPAWRIWNESEKSWNGNWNFSW